MEEKFASFQLDQMAFSKEGKQDQEISFGRNAYDLAIQEEVLNLHRSRFVTLWTSQKG